MASEITYAEVSFKTESKTTGTNSKPLSAPEEKTSPHKSNPSFPKLLLASLLILLLLLAISFFIAFIIFFERYSQLKEKMTPKEPMPRYVECERSYQTMGAWSCCPKNWTSFKSNCYLISSSPGSWNESEKRCSEAGAHLLVITTKDEQDFITQKLLRASAYYIGLSDPERRHHWQWIDQTPYNESATFWHQGEPSAFHEQCVILNSRTKAGKWGWNDIPCDETQSSICKMKKIYL